MDETNSQKPMANVQQQPQTPPAGNKQETDPSEEVVNFFKRLEHIEQSLKAIWEKITAWETKPEENPATKQQAQTAPEKPAPKIKIGDKVHYFPNGKDQHLISLFHNNVPQKIEATVTEVDKDGGAKLKMIVPSSTEYRGPVFDHEEAGNDSYYELAQ